MLPYLTLFSQYLVVPDRVPDTATSYDCLIISNDIDRIPSNVSGIYDLFTGFRRVSLSLSRAYSNVSNTVRLVNFVGIDFRGLGSPDNFVGLYFRGLPTLIT